MNNYVKIDKFSPFREYFFYVDCRKLLADDVFISNGLSVKFHADYRLDGFEFIWVYCSVRRRDVPLFKKCMKELYNKLLILGYTNYDKFCKEVCGGVLQGFDKEREREKSAG